NVQKQILKLPIHKPKGTKGAGIGLLLAQTIVQAYGGDIYVGSTDRTGTTMVIWLPLEGGMPTRNVSSGESGCMLWSGRQDSTWPQGVSEALVGLATVTVMNEDKAVEVCVQQPCDLILIDATVGMDISALIGRLLERRPEARIVVGAALRRWAMARTVFK